MSDCQCSKSHDSSGFVSGFALGLILGAAGAQFLTSTDQGKELLENLKEKAGDAIESIKDNPDLSEKIADLQSTMDKARASINTAAERVAQVTEPSKHAPKKNFFQKMGASLGK